LCKVRHFSCLSLRILDFGVNLFVYKLEQPGITLPKRAPNECRNFALLNIYLVEDILVSFPNRNVNNEGLRFFFVLLVTDNLSNLTCFNLIVCLRY
jgi:hypothetical protein